MKKVLGILLSALFLVVSGCTNKADAENKKAGSDSAIQNLNSIEIINNTKYDEIIASHKGKIIVVNFFASWCPPCKIETPDFVEVYNEYKDKNFVIIGISIDDNMQNAVDFVKQYGINYPVYIADRQLQSYYGVQKVPTSFLLDKDGKIIDMAAGIIPKEALKKAAEFGSK